MRNRASDLLIAEHLASQALRDLEAPATTTDLVRCGNRLFLESPPFDRRGERGRIGIVSLAALVDHHFGRRDNWKAAANSLRRMGVVSQASAEAIRRASIFGELIGNTDMHCGNLPFFFSFKDALALAPVYDMLPMAYALVGAGELPVVRLEPALPSPANVGARSGVAERAERYCREEAEHERVSGDFAAVGAENAAAIARARKLLL